MTHNLNSKIPWFESETLEFLSSLLKSDWTILETGCGGSTIWYSRRVKKVVSFESSPKWFHDVLDIIGSKEIRNVELHLYIDYPTMGIQGFKEDEFDFISIDGRGRMKSIETAIPYLKLGGYLLLDDSQRERYQQAFTLVDNWDYETYGKNKKQATIWRKS